MTKPTPASSWSPRLLLALTACLLVFGLVPPGGIARPLVRSLKSPEAGHSESERQAVGYYEGLIDIGGESGLDELALRLLGKPDEWKSFHDIGATRYLRNDYLQFELRPNLDRRVFGSRFTTNAEGLRDKSYEKEKPADVYRIALLGSSIDMGWGVGTDETYEARLEHWLNEHAAKCGLTRRFEVLNFAMAAYSPLHRLEAYRRKVREYDPDLVLFSATMLDTRLLEIQLGLLIQDRVPLKDACIRRVVRGSGITPDELKLDLRGELREKDRVKAKLRPWLWEAIDGTLGALAAECRSDDVGLAMLIVPRASSADASEARAGSVARWGAIASHHAIPVLDLSGTFDRRDPSEIAIAAWDDHPNAFGHRLLARALARAIVNDPPLYQSIFGVPLADPIRALARPGEEAP